MAATGVTGTICIRPSENTCILHFTCKTIVRKAAQFITQPLFLFFTKAFSPLTLQVKYGGIKKERKKGSTAIYVESMAQKHPRCETPQAACQHQENRTKAQN